MVIFQVMRPLEQEKIAVIGLGYVGLPVAIAFGRKLPTIGFDIRQRRIDQLRRRHLFLARFARIYTSAIRAKEGLSHRP